MSRAPFDTCNLARSVGDDPEHVEENRRRFARASGFEDRALFGVSQVHGARTVVLTGAASAAQVADEEADALVAAPSIDAAIGVRVADCVPLLLADPHSGAVAAVHAGWRGIVRGVIAAAVGSLGALGVPASRLLAAIGPHIRSGAFEVGPEVAEEMACALPHVQLLAGTSARGRPRIDLTRAVVAQLCAAGLRPEAVEDVGGCTFSEPERFFSFRRDGKRSGRLVGAIATRPLPR